MGDGIPAADILFVRKSHPDRNTSRIRSKFKATRMRLIVQQTACPANLIKLLLHVYSYYSRNIIPDGPFIVVLAVYGAAVSLYMAGGNRRRDFGMGQRFRMADTAAYRPSVFNLATKLTLLSLTYIYRG